MGGGLCAVDFRPVILGRVILLFMGNFTSFNIFLSLNFAFPPPLPIFFRIALRMSSRHVSIVSTPLPNVVVLRLVGKKIIN